MTTYRGAGWMLVGAVMGCGRAAPPPPPPMAPVAVAAPTQTAASAVAAPTAGRSEPDGSAAAGLPDATSPIPERLVVDGSVAEWPETSAPLRVALGADALVIAAALPAGVTAIELAISTRIPQAPDVGWVSRGGYTYAMSPETCRHEQIPWIEGEWKQGAAHPKEVVDACLAIVKRRDAVAAEFYERFVRRFRVSRDGLRTLAGEAIAGIEEATSEGQVEARLPKSAMPWFFRAPVTELLVHAAAVGPRAGLPADLPLPIIEYEKEPDPHWRRLKLTRPVGFEPHAELRALVLADAPGLGTVYDPARAYHPTEPNVIRTLVASEAETTIAFGETKPSRLAITETTSTLFQKVEELGDVTVALVDDVQLVTLRDDALVAKTYFGNIRSIQRRNDQLHFFHYVEGGFSPMAGYSSPRWEVVAVDADGKIADDIADISPDYMDFSAWDAPPKTFSSPVFTLFGMRGLRKKTLKTVSWKWDEDAGRYSVSIDPKSQIPADP
ncbi:MAG: hypothetical protein KC731_13735 [Myxococcales bacterium]|nr:hypothetical protein [Myxococcales bacterium]